MHSSDVEPLPHQICAVYQKMLNCMPLRYVLADDPGSGKTIMTGLLVRELMARGALGRCLIVCPGCLAAQWQEELFQKFNLRFEILNRERIEAAVTGNVFAEVDLAICRLDMLSRDDALQEMLGACEWDLIVCDEAHKMSASIYGGSVKMTRRFQLGRLLSGICRHFLLLTATPHNGKEEDFQLFLSIVDQDRFGGVAKTGARAVSTADVMRRLVKEELLKFDGSPLFPDRQAITLNYALSPLESKLYEAVTAYVQSEFNRADLLNKKRRATVGFALTVLQRRLASSPEAIYQSLRRRRERLQKRLAAEREGAGQQEIEPLQEDFDEDDLPAAELEEMEEQLADRASASSSITELEAEIATLATLEQLAAELRASSTDRKWEELSGLLQQNERMHDASGNREKLIIFTEHRDTLRYLESKIRSLLGNDEAVVSIYGGMSRAERRKAEARFKQDREALIMVATDAAGEGLNLQRSHLMVNYDLPWNPNRLEQRFGRIHRIGQAKTCWLWNLVASETREGAVFQRLFAKLEQEKAALGGKVFDILGKISFNNRPLRELLIEAVRAKDAGEESSLCQIMDAALDREALLELLRERALTGNVFDAAFVATMREEMERMQARRLQPYYMESFFREAFASLGGKIAPRENGRFEITHVPAILRSRAERTGGREPVLNRYERVCFDKARKDGQVQAELLCPGHPLLQAVLATLREREGDLLRRGAVLIDENDAGEHCRLLFYIESAIQDGSVLANGKRREISRQIHFVQLNEEGFAANGGYAPYLDYRPATATEQEAIAQFRRTLNWLAQDTGARAMAYAATQLVPRHLQEIRQQRLALLARTEKEVRQRLTAEIQYWDLRAVEWSRQEREGKRNAARNSAQARKNAETLHMRMHKRLEQLDRERQISALPPVLAGGCLVVPQGLLNRLAPQTAVRAMTQDAAARQEIEARAMAAVLALEQRLGYLPRDVSAEKCGYDIESVIPENLRAQAGACLRFIEVKGRAKGADSITVTRNEIVTALNRQEQFILALVEVDGDKTHTTYLKRPFRNQPDYSVTCCNFNLASLLRDAEKILEHQQ